MKEKLSKLVPYQTIVEGVKIHRSISKGGQWVRGLVTQIIEEGTETYVIIRDVQDFPHSIDINSMRIIDQLKKK